MRMQPEALRLADELASWEFTSSGLCVKAADELRRLHRVNVELLEALVEIVWSNNTSWQSDRARAAIKKAEEA